MCVCVCVCVGGGGGHPTQCSLPGHYVYLDLSLDTQNERAQELCGSRCGSRCGRPGLPSLAVLTVPAGVNNVREEETRNEELSKNDNWPEISIMTEVTD